MFNCELNLIEHAYRVIEVFPMGALPRKSRAIGLIHITTTTSGDRKLICNRILERKKIMFSSDPGIHHNSNSQFTLNNSAIKSAVALLNDWTVCIQLNCVQVSLGQSKSGESEESSNEGANNSQTQFYGQLGEWNSEPRQTEI